MMKILAVSPFVDTDAAAMVPASDVRAIIKSKHSVPSKIVSAVRATVWVMAASYCGKLIVSEVASV